MAGSPQQCTPITVGPSKIIKYGQFENTTQLIAIQHHTVQYNTIQYMYNTIHHNRIQYYSKDKIQLPPPLPPPAAEYLVTELTSYMHTRSARSRLLAEVMDEVESQTH